MPAKEDYLYEVGQELHIGKFNGIILENNRKDGRKYCVFKCLNCENIDEKLEYMIRDGSGCRCCYGRKVKVGFNDISTTTPWMVKFFQGGVEEAQQYTKSSHKKIIPICPFCNKIAERYYKINTIYGLHGFGCICKDTISIPNKMIYNISKQLKDSGQISKYKREFYIDKSIYPFDMCITLNNGDDILI